MARGKSGDTGDCKDDKRLSGPMVPEQRPLRHPLVGNSSVLIAQTASLPISFRGGIRSRVNHWEAFTKGQSGKLSERSSRRSDIGYLHCQNKWESVSYQSEGSRRICRRNPLPTDDLLLSSDYYQGLRHTCSLHRNRPQSVSKLTGVACTP
jgi:hypothetical protein